MQLEEMGAVDDLGRRKPIKVEGTRERMKTSVIPLGRGEEVALE